MEDYCSVTPNFQVVYVNFPVFISQALFMMGKRHPIWKGKGEGTFTHKIW